MSQESQMDISKTFESQKELVVKMIVPTIKQLLDPVTYSITENIVYQIIHRRHHFQ